MAKHYAMAAKVQQIHDVLQMMLDAIEDQPFSGVHPIHGVVCMLIDQSRDVANKLSDPAYSGDEVHHDLSASGSKEDA